MTNYVDSMLTPSPMRAVEGALKDLGKRNRTYGIMAHEFFVVFGLGFKKNIQPESLRKETFTNSLDEFNAKA